MDKAPVCRIIEFSAVDGPGNRTAVFLQGCNFSCAYCHNPETQRMCICCGDCVKGCPAGALAMQEGQILYDYEKCIFCDSCLTACSHYANPRIRWMTPEEVLAEAMKNQPFIRGITVSGGECTLYPEFLLTLCRQSAAAGLPCMLDTNGMLDFSRHASLLDATEGLMLDVKAFNESTHYDLTGQFNDLVKRTAALAAARHKLYELRTLCLPGFVDAERCILGMADLLGHHVEEIRYKLIAFRPFGVRGQLESMMITEETYMRYLAKIATDAGYKSVEIV